MEEITIQDAIKNNNILAVENLITNAGMDPNAPLIYQGSSTTPLDLCIRHHNLNIAKLLLENGADPIGPLPDDRTPLRAAIHESDIEMVKLLLDHGAECQMYDTLIYVVERDDPKAFLEFLKRGVDIRSSQDRSDCPIICATRSKSYRVLDMLIEAGVSVNVVDRDGYAPIQIWEPGRNGSRQYLMLNQLLESGADINAQDSAGDTPLLKSIKYLDGACVDCLVREKADLNIKNTLGQTALSLAMERDDLRVAKVLIKSGADTSSVSPEMEARARADEDFAEFLLLQIGQRGVILPQWVQEMKELKENWEQALMRELGCTDILVPRTLSNQRRSPPYWLTP